MALMSALGGLIGGVSSLAGGNTGSQSSTTKGTSTPTFTPGQTALQGSLGAALSNEVTNGINIAPAETSGTNAINNTYKGIGQGLQQSLSSRGFGSGGAGGSAALATELGRGGAVGNLESSLQQYAVGQQQNALGMGLQEAFADPGSATTGSSSGTYTNPSSVPAGILSGFGGGAAAGMSMPAGSLGASLNSWNPFGGSGGGGDLGNGQINLGD